MLDQAENTSQDKRSNLFLPRRWWIKKFYRTDYSLTNFPSQLTFFYVSKWNNCNRSQHPKNTLASLPLTIKSKEQLNSQTAPPRHLKHRRAATLGDKKRRNVVSTLERRFKKLARFFKLRTFEFGIQLERFFSNKS